MKTPGPGTYDSSRIGLVRPKSPTWRYQILLLHRIGSSKKDDGYREIERRGVPGPGIYQTKSTLSGPLYR